MAFLQEIQDLPCLEFASGEPPVEVSLLIPARNAGEVLEHTVSTAHAFLSRQFGSNFEIVLIPNPAAGNPADHSIDVSEALARRYSQIRVVPHLSPPGKGAALRTGFAQSRGRLIFFTDADLPYELDFFERATVELRRGVDLVSGNRRLPNSHFHMPVTLLHLAYARHRLGLWFNRVVRFLLPIHTTDTQAGIKAMSRDLALKAFGAQVCPGFFFDLEFFMTAAGQGFLHTELPVTLHLNSEKSTVRVLRESILAGYWLARITYRHFRGRYGSAAKSKVSGSMILSGYENCSLGTRFFLNARWYLTPYLEMVRHLPKSGTILDLGCGHGLLAKAIALTRLRCQVTAFDHDETRIRLAETAAKNIGNLRFRVNGMKFPEQKFNGITLIDVMHYFPPAAQKELIDQAYAALAPGGRLLVREVEPEAGIISSLNRFYEKLATSTGFTRSKSEDLHFRNTAQWEALFREAGFQVRSERCSSIFFSDVLFICERGV
ncbi:MAG TPA: hypothetical protein DCS07_00420 [Bdellovibrionales bacterium]|nr:MAG: hypothetical protein A2Z97_12770 [Bdellovibrionales bacterium GWB1_52_6]OFZ02844.1 MAG: hypothetical protein A2X97_04530 [Bdellovibrionales bacterium GWA1_52_35]HAR41094.1 hypothetical protein [Bdellovibrionales bacterium]HCM38426.1 hypothetical protein [Bdellovibrionales bacterium]